MTDLFETRVENLEPKENKKNLQQLPSTPRRTPRKGNGKTLTPVLYSPVKNPL